MEPFRIRDLFVEVTNLCMQGCVHCSSCAGPHNFQYIPINNLRALIDDCLPMGLKSFTISGGEPLLYPDLFPLISYIREKGLIFNLYTCGVCQSQEGALEAISNENLDKLVEKKINKLIFSLQGGSALVHERVSGLKESFGITKRSIRRALSKKIAVELHFVPMAINFEDIENVVKIASELGIKQVSLLRLIAQGRCDEKLMLSRDLKLSLNSIVKDLGDKYPEVAIRLGAPFNCITLSSQECTAAKNKLLVSANGDVFPCEAFKYLKGQRPTIYNSDIKDVWENDKLLNDIRALESNEVDLCKGCSLHSACKSGCHGQRMLFSGSLFTGTDPDCQRKRLLNAEEAYVYKN